MHLFERFNGGLEFGIDRQAVPVEHCRLGIEPGRLGRLGQFEILLGLVLHRLQRQQALAVEFGPMGINVNCIGPGFYPSEANEVVRNNQTFYDWVSGRSPLNRWGDPKELGGAAIYFASDASSFCNGQVLTIDGGMTVAL